MRKLIPVLAILATVFALSACGSTTKTVTQGTLQTATQTPQQAGRCSQLSADLTTASNTEGKIASDGQANNLTQMQSDYQTAVGQDQTVIDDATLINAPSELVQAMKDIQQGNQDSAQALQNNDGNELNTGTTLVNKGNQELQQVEPQLQTFCGNTGGAPPTA